MGQTSKGEEEKRTKKYLKVLLAKKHQMIFILFLFYLHAYATTAC